MKRWFLGLIMMIQRLTMDLHSCKLERASTVCLAFLSGVRSHSDVGYSELAMFIVSIDQQ